MLTARKVLEKFRDEVGDPEIPGVDEDPSHPDMDSLWKNSEIYGYMDEAQAWLARRAYLLVDNFELPIKADESLVDLPEEFYEPRRAKVKGQNHTLTLLNLNELQSAVREDYGVRGVDDWEEVTGPPQLGVLDHTPGKIRLVPIPVEAGTLSLNAFIEPSEAITGSASYLALSNREQVRTILHWMKKLAYSKQDADVLDLQRAQSFEREGIAAADELMSEQRRRTRRSGTVRYGGL